MDENNISDEDENLTYEQLRTKRIEKNEEMFEWVVFSGNYFAKNLI